MKSIFVILTLIFGVFTTANAQTAPRFSKNKVGEKGCTVYLPESDAVFEKSLSADSAAVFIWEKIIL